MMIKPTDDCQVMLEVPYGPMESMDRYLSEVMDWCMEQGIATYVIGAWEETDYGANDVLASRKYMSMWSIVNPEHRALFLLKWS